MGNNLLTVQGHSGCQIEVIRDQNKLFIIKSTSDPKYFKRLILQAKKQQNASRHKMQFIRVPVIHEIIETEDGVAIRMDYIYSRNFVEFFEHAGFEQVNYLIDALIMFIEKEIEKSEYLALPKNIITNKFDDVKLKIINNKFLQSKDYSKKIASLITKSDAIFQSLPPLLNLPVGTCHGDLTFSNILFNGNNYYLIDFLDSFIESPLLDIVKLRQDTAWQWSKFMYNGNFDNIRLKIAFGKIDTKIATHFLHYGWYREFYKPMQLMNFLRILQYAHEKEVTDFLISSINSQLSDLKA